MATMVVFVSLLGLLYAASSMSATEVKDSHAAIDDVRAQYLAEAGIERGTHFIGQAIRNNNVQNPLLGVTDLFLGGPTITPFIGQPVMNGVSQVGAFSVSLTALAQTATSITIAIDATGYLPDAPSALAPGQELAAWRAVRTTVRYTTAPSKVFDYGYFINNWGWFYGNTIRSFGNARSNGQFDVANYAPTVTGQPLYDSVSWNGIVAKLAGYQDDNHNGLMDGKDGGIFSGWDIVRAQNVVGEGGKVANQHEFEAPIEMPNLTDLSRYETQAIAASASITINGVVVSDAVCGDEHHEEQNLYLVGTAAKPIVLNGPVVVRGHVIIKGVVTGKGAIYSGGNVYVPDSITYANAPTTPRPANNTQASTEAWLTTNWNKDFLGLFARENIVVGDYTHPVWRANVGAWMGNALNASAEDAGADGIPNTKAGRDGILGTVDDDVLEGDGIFTIERYTAADDALGLIPAGKHVGDAIPGTGEDIDGDGVYDDATKLSDIDIAGGKIKSSKWDGNLPPGGVDDYDDIASMSANRLDATFYTNHSFCYVVTGGTAAKINGAVVSRNENIIYSTPTMDINQDCRLLGGASGRASGFLPTTMQPVEMLRWAALESDPNRQLVAP